MYLVTSHPRGEGKIVCDSERKMKKSVCFVHTTCVFPFLHVQYMLCNMNFAEPRFKLGDNGF